MYDVVIIGAGVTGCAIARELSRYQLKICVLEKEEDVCCQTSKANSGIVHAGHDAVPGSKKAEFNIIGNRMMDQLTEELDIPFKRNGSLVLCFDEKKLPLLEKLKRQGEENGVPDLSILSAEEVLEKEPHLSSKVVAALYAPTGGIICPFELTIALAENAAVNGTEFQFNTEVEEIEKLPEGGYLLKAGGKEFRTRTVINAAGVYGDIFHNMVSEKKIHITPRKGEYCLLDKKTGDLVQHTIFQLPDEMGKGVLVTPTVHGNLMIGPTAEDVEERESCNTTAAGLKKVQEKAGESISELPFSQVITSFAGLRAHEDAGDFITREIQDAPGFFDAVGIESPGLTAAPAIGICLAELTAEYLKAEKKTGFQPKRKGISGISEMTAEEIRKKVEENPAYGTVVCRCETVTEGEILEAIHRPLGAKSLDGIKRRTRAGMGRCQAGFCSTKVLEILSREYGVPETEITKSGGNSNLIVSDRKQEGKA